MSIIPTPKEVLDGYIEMRNEIFEGVKEEGIISNKDQELEISLLKRYVSRQRFFFVVNLFKMELEHVYGVDQWLGYSNNSFDLFKYLQCLHPSHVVPHALSSMNIIEGFMRGKHAIEFIKHRFTSTIVLKDSNNQYKTFNRIAVCFQYDKSDRLLAYLNEFHYLREYREDLYEINADAERKDELGWINNTFSEMKSTFKTANFFSGQELQVIREYAYNTRIKTKEVASRLGVKESSVVEYKKRIMEKSYDIFKRKFNTIKEIAESLRIQNLI